MANPEAVRYRWIQYGGAWTEATVLSTVDWTNADADLIPVTVPLQVTKHGGPEPNEFTFQIWAASTQDVAPGTGVYGADNVVASSSRRPDGTSGDCYYPMIDAAYPLKEFELIQLMDAPDAASKGSGVSVFVGVVTELELTSTTDAGDMWTATVSEIARWHMGRIAVTGTALHRHSQGDNKWQADTLPVFNEEGKPDQHCTSDGTAQGRFINQDHNTIDGASAETPADFAGYWALGEVLNYLRREYNQTGAGEGNGSISTSEYLTWAEAAAGGTWDFLFALDTVDQIVKDLALGGMSLAEAIDQIVTKAGPYEWRCEWDAATSKYILAIYSGLTGDGASAKSYTRGTLGGSVGSTPPECDNVNLKWRWNEALTQVKPLGAKMRWEISADTGSGGSFQGGLAKGWTSAQETAYEGDKAAGEKYPSVFQRYIFADDINWETYFGHANFLSGHRRPLPKLLSAAFGSDGSASQQPVKLSILAWRYKGSAWEPAPDGVSVHIDSDGSILITGHAPEEPDRWGENGSGTAYDIGITIAVEDDARLTSASAVTDKPTGWPTLEKAVDHNASQYEADSEAYLPVDGSNQPVLDNPSTARYHAGSGSPAVLKNDRDTLTKVAKRTLSAHSRPRLEGSIRVYALDWTIAPGQKVATLTGGGSRPSMTINAVVASIVYDMSEGNESMTLTFGGDTV